MQYTKETFEYIKHRFIHVETPIEKIRTLRNFVIVELEDDVSSDIAPIKNKSVLLYTDRSWAKEEQSIISGTVRMVPEKLKYQAVLVHNLEGDGAEAISEYDADMDLQTGDTVYFHHLSYLRAKKNGLLFTTPDRRLMCGIVYDKIYLAKRNDTFFATNGHIFLQKVKHESSLLSNYLEIASKKGIWSLNVGKAVLVGKPLRRYHALNSVDGHVYGADSGFIIPGDTVFFYNSTYVGNELDRPLGKAVLDRIHEREAIARIRKGVLTLNKHTLLIEPTTHRASNIIIGLRRDQVENLISGKVIKAPANFEYLVGQEVYYEKGMQLTFDYRNKEYTFVINVYTDFHNVKGRIVLCDF